MNARGENGIGRRVIRYQEEGREWRLPGFLHADDFVLCGESEECLRSMRGRFLEACRRRGLKFSSGKSKVMLVREARLECEVCVDRIRLGYVSEYKYLR